VTRFVVVIGLLLTACGRIGFSAHSGDATDASQDTFCAGGRGFVPGQLARAGSGTRALAVADLDEDGRSDVIATEGASGTVSVLINQGDGTLHAPVDTALGTSPFSVATGDVDGDGHVDVVVGLFGDHVVKVLHGGGDGTLTVTATLPATGEVQGVAVGDVDGDGRQDIVAVEYDTGVVDVYFNNGGGFTIVPLVSPAGGYSVVLGNFALDGLADVIVTGSTLGKVRPYSSEGANRQLANNTDVLTSTQATPQPWNIIAADFDRDGLPELAVANNYSTSTIAILDVPNNPGFIGPSLIHELPASTTSWALAAGDIDGDGVIDLVCADGLDTTASVYHGNGDGTFAARVTYPAGGTALSIGLVDLDGDGDLDIVTADQEAGVGILLSRCQ
jgi:VCBS repeat protein